MHCLRSWNALTLLTRSTLALATVALVPGCSGDSTADSSATATTTDATTTAGTTSETTTTTTTTTEATTEATSTDTTTTEGTTTEGTTTAGTTTEGTTTEGTTGETTGTTTGGGEPVIVEGFSHPESVLWSAMEMRWYVSNIGGDPSAKDGDGFISRLAADGTVEAMNWATGLDAPKGSGIAGGRLYVADLDQVRVLDTGDGSLLMSVPIPGAVFLNDVAVSMMGEVYVSDTGTNTIHRLTGGMMSEVVVTSADLHGPNGLTFAGDRLIVASYGDMNGDGAVFRMMGMTPIQVGTLTGSLDGLVARMNDYLVTDFNGLLYRVPADGSPHEIVRDFVVEDGFLSSADIGLARTLGILAVPDLLGDRVGFFPLQ
ncbi:MAG: hypothetical protein R3B09_29880 [Nannocystaceae bacterium]